MLICLIYPTCYESLQIYKSGVANYFSEPWNYIDICHILFGIINVFCQRLQPDILNKSNIVFMMLVAILLLFKLFFFLRIVNSMSFLVSMLMKVFYDLRPFITLQLILLIAFSTIVGVADWGQYEYDDEKDVRGIQYTGTGPDKEYLQVHKLFSRVFYMLRTSLNDNNFDASTYLKGF